MYLCYDIKGIQRYIFSIPKLKCVVGGSGLIAEFDRDARENGGPTRAEWIFSGGGRGAFHCPSQDVARSLERHLIAAAHSIGLDIRLGIDEALSQAAHHADRLYPYCPESLDGMPCRVSGLWPSPEGKPHPLVGLRYATARRDHLGTWIIDRLREFNLIPPALQSYEMSFFKSVKPEPEADGWDDDTAEAQAGQAALGGRNRWAIVAMDGNDMGRQFLAFEANRKRENWGEETMRHWLRAMSESLADCTRRAFLNSLAAVLEAWAKDTEDDLDDCVVEAASGSSTERLILPFRPLILGGDDVTMLCHPTYAMSFVQQMAKHFQNLARQAAKDAKIQPLWPATGGELTISAGILYAKTTFPLHMAIPYAESLLASAKGRFRADPNTQEATPAAVDWDAITDSLVDTPAGRRNRDLRFLDRELNVEIQLTRRPYLLEDGQGHPSINSLVQLKSQLASIPRSVRAEILPNLQRPWSERVAFLTSVAKRHPLLQTQLGEDGQKLGSGWDQAEAGQKRATGLPDALLLLNEEHRMSQAKADD